MGRCDVAETIDVVISPNDFGARPSVNTATAFAGSVWNNASVMRHDKILARTVQA